ncbi:acyl-homoserine-lactone synthase [Sphingomonas sp. OTU376]|uniref:acyl-homoserine-lactone synthase n=1 Tax=Sphingomonas sp. OTU376 TaxID=3043863 RepID=UPI00313B8557
MFTGLVEKTQSDRDAAMRAMFRARKEVFVDLLKWDLPVLDGRFELDQFDNPDASYLILVDEDGAHRASARLLRTDQPHLLGDIYPHLCAGPVPTGPHIREITRFCLDRHQSALSRRIARDQLVTALCTYALSAGISEYTGVAETSWFDQVRRFGWECKALGPAVRVEGRWLVGLHILIDEETPDRLRRGGVYETASLALHAPAARELVQ